MEALLTSGTARKPGLSIEVARLFLYPLASVFILAIVFTWVCVFLKLPRLELTSCSIKYLTFSYSLEVAWENVEQIKMFTRTQVHYERSFLPWNGWSRVTVNIGRGLVASKYSLHVTQWGRLFEMFGYPTYQGIQIERAFASNIYIGELAMDMKQYIPHVFENNPYLV